MVLISVLCFGYWLYGVAKQGVQDPIYALV